MKKLLIFGGSGLLGYNCSLYLKDKFHIATSYNSTNIKVDGVKSIFYNINGEDFLEKIIKDVNPYLIINCSGIANVEKCEENRKNAFKINTLFPERLAKLSLKYSIKLVHISTDHLFDGRKPFRKESDITSPQNYYGLSKLNADLKILDCNSNSLIIRTNFFGKGTKDRTSFSDYIINNLVSKSNIYLFEDMFFTPIHINILIDTIIKLFELNLDGIFNVVSSERISKYDFGIKIADKLNFNKKYILRGKLRERKDLEKRPFDLSLSNEKIRNIVDKSTLEIDKQIELLLK